MRIHDANFYNTIFVVKDAEQWLDRPREALGLVGDYDPSLKELLGHEGGYTNDPKDPGGPTNWGITIFDARMYWKSDATAADVRAMPLRVAKDIYKAKYWNKVRGDELPAGIDYCVFDFGVNSGVSRAVKYLQRFLGVKQTGEMNGETLTAVNVVCDVREKRDQLINTYQDARLKFLQGLGTWGHFGLGWGRRVKEVRALALRMSANPTGMVVSPAPLPQVPAPAPAPAPVSPPAPKPQPRVEPDRPGGLWVAIADVLVKLWRGWRR